MKKVLVVVLMFVTLFGLSGCDKEENNKEIKQEVLIVEYRNDYYDFDCGDYYYYRFEVGQNGNTFKDGNRRWFKTNEKWEIDDERGAIGQEKADGMFVNNIIDRDGGVLSRS